MNVRFIGGTLDGRVVDVACAGRYFVQPVMTQAYVEAHREWFEKYGVAWALETLDGIPEHPVTPPPPSFPEELYTWRREDDGELVATLALPAEIEG